MAGYLRCVGKPNAEAGLPDTAGFEAAQGTVFHELVSDCLELGLEPEDFLGGKLIENGFEIPYDEDMVRYARDGLDFIRSVAAQPNVELYVETRVDISPWTLPGQFSTSDVVLVNVPERWVIVLDWKYGMEPVYPQENEQGQGYALGSWQTIFGERFGWDPSGIDVTIIIEQPRVPGAGGQWKTTMTRLLEFGKFWKRQAVRTTDPKAPRTPGPKQCRYCKASATCAEQAAWHLENMNLEFEDLDEGFVYGTEPTLPANLTPEHRSYLLEIRPMVNKWFDALHKSEYADALAGRPTPGRKLVEGRRPGRKWLENAEHKAEQALVRLLGEEAYKPKEHLTPAAAETALKRKGLKDAYEDKLKRFVDEGTPSPIMVPESDSRLPVKSALDEFDSI